MIPRDLLLFEVLFAPPTGPPPLDFDPEYTLGAALRTPTTAAPRFRRFLPAGEGGAEILDPELDLYLFHRSSSEQPQEITGSFAESFQAQLNEAGTGTITIPNDDPILADLELDDLILFRRRGVPAFVSTTQALDRATIHADEEHGQVTKIEGPGHLSLLGEGLVFPSRGPDQFPIELDRVFNWASPFLDDSGWGPARTIVQQSEPSLYWTGLPQGFPGATGAFWIGGESATQEWANPGWSYFRTTFTVPDGVTRAICYLGADAQAEVWLDGQLMMTSTYTNADPTKLFTVIFDITPGDHLIAVGNLNDPDPEGDQLHNPGGFVLAVVPIDNVGTVADPSQTLVATDQFIWPWKLVDTTTPFGLSPVRTAPGMTVGRLLGQLVAEIQARGALLDLVLMFGDEFDSEGQPWLEVGSFGTKVGNDLFTFVRELTATYLDVWMGPEPSRLELYAYQPDGRGRFIPETLHGPTDPGDPDSSNLTALNHKVLR